MISSGKCPLLMITYTYENKCTYSKYYLFLTLTTAVAPRQLCPLACSIIPLPLLWDPSSSHHHCRCATVATATAKMTSPPARSISAPLGLSDLGLSLSDCHFCSAVAPLISFYSCSGDNAKNNNQQSLMTI